MTHLAAAASILARIIILITLFFRVPPSKLNSAPKKPQYFRTGFRLGDDLVRYRSGDGLLNCAAGIRGEEPPTGSLVKLVDSLLQFMGVGRTASPAREFSFQRRQLPRQLPIVGNSRQFTDPLSL